MKRAVVVLKIIFFFFYAVNCYSRAERAYTADQDIQ